jgi:hypothetical protein
MCIQIKGEYVEKSREMITLLTIGVVFLFIISSLTLHALQSSKVFGKIQPFWCQADKCLLKHYK